MTLPPQLAELRLRLQDAGVVVVEEPDHLTVRLPFFCSLRVRLDDDRLRVEPYFGMLPRTKSTIIRFIVLAALSTGGFKVIGPWGTGFAVPVGLAAIALLVGLQDVIRWTVSEQAITKTQLIWSMMRHGSVAPRELGAGSEIPYSVHQQRDRVR